MTDRIRAYGDREGDGMVQMSFTLEVLPGDRAREAAKRFAEAHGLKNPLVVAMEQASQKHSYFVVYGHSVHDVDLDSIRVEEILTKPMTREEVIEAAKPLARKIVVVGACIGSDAHTVGIDAIINYKGFNGDKGLESYKCFDAHNLGAQVEIDELLARARSVGADALLVSQVITQRDCHKENAKLLVTELERAGLRDRYVLLFGGPRIDNPLAKSLGFDAGFGAGTVPSQVAAFVVEQVLARELKAPARADRE